MAIEDKQGFWIDASGKPVPKQYVDVDDRKKDRLVEQLMKKAKRLQQDILEFKKEANRRIDKYLRETAGKYDEEDWKGNATLTDFSNTVKVEVKVNNLITFNEKLQLAKQKLDTFFVEVTKDARPELQALVQDAFAADSRGSLNKRQILRLRRVKIDHPVWKKAMGLIDEAISVESTKQYINFHEKPQRNQDAEYDYVPLNFSSLEVTGDE